MRITNQMMQKNSMNQINKNKLREDKLFTQYATQKKIFRPSDDPVIAVRALKLRSAITQSVQYKEKNVEDAKAWMKLTEDSVNSTMEVITNLYDQCVKAANGGVKPEDRQKILDYMTQLRDEIYATGNADYAGRYVFTGYRTGTPLTFKNATEQKYTITEQLTSAALETITHVNTKNAAGKDLMDINSGNATDTGGVEAKDITCDEIHRIRLAYGNCDKGTDDYVKIKYHPNKEIVAETFSINGPNDPYQEILDGDQDTPRAIFVPETGELLLNEAAFKDLNSVKDDPVTKDKNEGEIQITYEKTEWNKNDLKPEHYFNCKTTSSNGDEVEHNADFLINPASKESAQIINYDVGLNQSIRVNTLASEIYTHAIGRDVDDLINVTQSVIDMAKVVATLEELIKQDPGNAELEKRLAAAEEALTFLDDKMQKMFERGETKFLKHLDHGNVAHSKIGSRGQRLDLIESRLENQIESFELLQSENEDADMTQVIVDLTAASSVYEGSLYAIGMMSKTSLLNYI